jgi:hypothetical protein
MGLFQSSATLAKGPFRYILLFRPQRPASLEQEIRPTRFHERNLPISSVTLFYIAGMTFYLGLVGFRLAPAIAAETGFLTGHLCSPVSSRLAPARDDPGHVLHVCSALAAQVEG